MDLISFVLGCSSCAFALCAFFLWFRRADGDRSRLILCVVWLLSALVLDIRVMLEAKGVLSVSGVLPPANLAGGLFVLTLYYFYPIEVIYPGWLNLRRTFYFLLPTILIMVIINIPGVEFRDLGSFRDVLAHIGEPDVYGRLIILFGIILPSSLLLYAIPYNWMRSRVRLRWITHYIYAILLIAVFYTSYILTHNILVSVVHQLVCLVFALIITYEELFARFRLPADTSAAGPTVPDMPEPQPVTTGDPLVARLNSLLEKEEVWQNPDLTAAHLAQMLGTNRNYLAHAVHEAGYANFADLINRRRVEAFCRMAEEGRVGNMQDAFFLVGFRSKETALRSFKKYMGLLPSEYLVKAAERRAKASKSI